MKSMFEAIEREPSAPQPVRYFQANRLTDALAIPAGQALITGLFAGVVAGGLASVLRVSLDPWTVGAVTGSAAALLAWMSSRSFWQWTIERILSDSLNIGRDPEPERQPEPQYLPAPSLRVELIGDEGRSGQFINLPCADRLPLLAEGLASGRQFSLTAWTGDGAPFTRPEFERLRDALITAGLARWRSERFPGRGMELTSAGRAIFKRLASGSPSPTSGE